MIIVTKRNFLLGVLALTAAGAFFAGSPRAAEQLEGQALVDAMGRGGYVIYMRHTKTDRDQKDGNITDFADCSTQRNLSAEGREDARQIGRLFRQWGVKVDQVLSSPYCRAVETAKLAFGKSENENNLRYLTRLSSDEAATASAWLKRQFGTAPAAGTNTILVAHTANLKQGVGIWPHNPGDIYVFRPRGGNNFELVGFITPDQWPGLAKSN